MLELKWNKAEESYNDFCSRVILNFKEYGFDEDREAYEKLTGVNIKDNTRKYRRGCHNIQKAIESGYAEQFASDIDIVEIPKSEELNGFYKNKEMIEVEDKEFLLNKIKRLEKQLLSTKDNLRIARADNTKEYRTETIWDKFVRDFKYVEPIKIDKVIQQKSKDKVAMLVISDTHFGMKFDGQLNKYNKEIAQERIKELTRKTIKYLNPEYKIIVLQLGDAVNGVIHTSTRINSDMDVVESTKVFTESMLGMLKEFCENFSEVEYKSVHGNHCRITPSKEESLEKENFVGFSDWYIKLAMREVSNFKFEDNKHYGIAEFTIFGNKMVALHGHQTSINNITNVSHVVGYIPSNIYLGHFHHLNIKDCGRTRVTVSPSMAGVDEYAFTKLLYGKPYQLLEVFYENGDKEIKELYL